MSLSALLILYYSTPLSAVVLFTASERDLTDYMYTDLWNSPSAVEEAMRGAVPISWSHRMRSGCDRAGGVGREGGREGMGRRGERRRGRVERREERGHRRRRRRERRIEGGEKEEILSLPTLLPRRPFTLPTTIQSFTLNTTPTSPRILLALYAIIQ